MANKVKALQQWCKHQVEGYRDVNITNMTSSWKSGLAFCALIHRFRPDLIDYDSLSKDDVYANNELAFRVAKNNLQIPDLLEAEDMVAMAVPDKLCIVTYLSQYYNVMRNMTPVKDGGSGEKRSPSKRTQATTPPDEMQAKRITVSNNSKVVQKNVQTGKTSTKQSMGDKCHICCQKIHLVERYLDGGKLYHRHCYRESQKSTLRAYRSAGTGKKPQLGSKPESPPAEAPLSKSNSPNRPAAPASGKAAGKPWKAMVANTQKRVTASSSSSQAAAPKPADSSHIPASKSSPLPAAVTAAVESPSLNPEDRLSNGDSVATAVAIADDTPAVDSSQPSETLDNEAQKDRLRNGDVDNLKSPTELQPSLDTSTETSMETTPLRQSPTFTISPVSSDVSLSSPSLTPNTSQQRPFPPASEHLSPSAEVLFPYFNRVDSPRAVPTATPAVTAEPMEVDNVKAASNCTVPSPPTKPAIHAAVVKPSRTGSTSRPAKLLSSNVKCEPVRKSDQELRSSLLANLVSIRQRHGMASKNSEDSTRGKHSSKNHDNSKRHDQRKSILKSEDGSVRIHQRPILKHKEPVSFNDSKATPATDSRPLRSILKADAESALSGTDTSPRSILKHPDEAAKEASSPRSNHSILKMDNVAATVCEANGDSSVLRRSILKTKDAASESESGSNLEESLRPGPSILKSRKSSGDSLLSSSGDELEDRRPILRTSPRAESAMSPSNEPKSILKSKNPSSHHGGANAQDSPKPILKSRDSSPNRCMSAMKGSEPSKPILKNDSNVQGDYVNSDDIPDEPNSPQRLSVLSAQKSEAFDQDRPPFAVFKLAATTRNYSSNLGLEPCMTLPLDSESSCSSYDVNEAGEMMVEGPLVESKQFHKDKSTARQTHPKSEQSLPVSQLNGAKKTGRSKGLAKNASQEGKPSWILEVEKRKKARHGKYVDPEKVPIGKTETKANLKVTLKPVAKVSHTKRDKEASVVHANNAVAPIISVIVPLDHDDRPEWQKEAEKRQARRKDNYPDPEKSPVRPRDRSGTAKKPSNGLKDSPSSGAGGPGRLGNGHNMSGNKSKTTSPENSIIKSAPSIDSDASSVSIDQRPKSAVAPPKPKRSPLPEQADTLEQPDTTISLSLTKPKSEWQIDAERRQKKFQENLTDIEKKSVSPTNSPRGGAPADLSDAEQGSEYSEIGPPIKKIPEWNAETKLDRKSANRPLPALPARRRKGLPPKRKVNAENRLSSHIIMRRLEDLDVNLQALEQEGRILEESIRSESDDAMDEADLMISWFELVNKKNELVRKESDLMYRHRQQELESQHEELEYDFRCLMEKSDKTPSEVIREEALLKELVATVMLRNNIVDSIEEDRKRYLEEDKEISQMMRTKGFSHKEETPVSEPDSPKRGKEKKNKDRRKDKKDKSRKRSTSCVR